LAGLAPFGDQLIHQGPAGLYMFMDELLRALDALAHAGDAKLIVVEAEDEFVARSNPQRLTNGSGYDNPSVLIDAGPYLWHVTFQANDMLARDDTLLLRNADPSSA
jgi:hypothetical protein